MSENDVSVETLIAQWRTDIEWLLNETEAVLRSQHIHRDDPFDTCKSPRCERWRKIKAALKAAKCADELAAHLDRPSSGASLGRGLDPEGEKAYERIHDTSPTQERVTVEEVTAGLGAEVVSPPGERLNGDAILRHMVNRFLAWRLPENFNPDGGISFTRDFNEHTPYPMKHEPTGTNLFTATQAEAMVRHLLGGDPDGATTARSRPIPLPDPLAPEGERRPPTESEKL